MKPASPIILLDADGIKTTLNRLAKEVLESLPEGQSLAVIGIRNRGEVLAARLMKELSDLGLENIEIGSLDITLYRDDLDELGPQAVIRKTEINFDIHGRYVILVDDVLHTGRSVRASLDALVDLGRPKAIRLAILVDRPGRELPIQADYIGISVPEADAPVTVHLIESDGIDEVRVG